MGGGYLRYRSNFLYELPLKRADNVVEKGIINKVDRILFGTKQDPAADTTALEAEIDRMVYELYGLTEEEIRIVEGAVG
jgi:adenine-specific DNA-methyltransferase